MRPGFSMRGVVIAAAMSISCFTGSVAAHQAAAQAVAPAPAGSQTVSQKIAASQDLLDINTATPEQLKALPGMGNAYAARVIAGRPYTAKNQLTMRGILPLGEYQQIKALIIAHRVKP